MIVVFGSLNVDFVMSVRRLPQPGETVIGGDYFLVPGGKGANQALAAARAGGARVAMVGQVGQDEWGEFAVKLLAEAGVDLSCLGRAEKATGCASIWVDEHGENAITVASGANFEARAAQVPDSWLGPDTWLVLQMEVTPQENWALVERASARGAKIVLNVAPAAPVPAQALAGVDVLIVNRVEAAMIAGAAGSASEDPAVVARELARQYQLTCITTLGAQGVIAHGPDGGWAADPLAVEAVDTTGAGDNFTGALAASLQGGARLPEALRRASVAAGICCTVRGTQSSFPRAEQIDLRLGELPPARGLE